MKIKLFGVDPEQVRFEKLYTKDETLYSWTMSQVKPWELQEDAPGRAHTAPYILFHIDHYEVHGQKKKVLLMGVIFVPV